MNLVEVGSVALGQQSVDLEWSDKSGVVLSHLHHVLRPGDTFEATFRFLDSPAVTLPVRVGPLGGSQQNTDQTG